MAAVPTDVARARFSLPEAWLVLVTTHSPGTQQAACHPMEPTQTAWGKRPGRHLTLKLHI